MQRRAQSQQYAGRSGRQVHREPKQLVAREREAALERHRVPAETAHQLVDLVLERGGGEEDAGATHEQSWLDVVAAVRDSLELLQRCAQLVVRTVPQVALEDERDTRRTFFEVRQRAPA